MKRSVAVWSNTKVIELNYDWRLLPFTMPPFMSASKAFGSLISRKIGVKHIVNSNRQLRNLDLVRRFSSRAGLDVSSIHKLIGAHGNTYLPSENVNDNANFVQRRRFLGCGDGEEGDGLSKVYEERRVLG